MGTTAEKLQKILDTKNTIKQSIINKGGIVIFPTETVYGIGTNGLDTNAVKNLYNIKKHKHLFIIACIVFLFGIGGIMNISKQIKLMQQL